MKDPHPDSTDREQVEQKSEKCANDEKAAHLTVCKHDGVALNGKNREYHKNRIFEENSDCAVWEGKAKQAEDIQQHSNREPKQTAPKKKACLLGN